MLVLRVAVRLLRAARRRCGWWSEARRGEDAEGDGAGVVLEDHTDLARGVDVKVIQTQLSTFCMENHSLKYAERRPDHLARGRPRPTERLHAGVAAHPLPDRLRRRPGLA